MIDFTPFKLWLEKRRYSTVTVRNYLADIKKFIEFTGKSSSDIATLLTLEVVSAYVQDLSTNSNARRYLASLNVYCQFGIDQHLIEHNPLQIIRKKSTLGQIPGPSDVLRQYQQLFNRHLSDQKYPQSTIRNYINDVDQYINWLNSQNIEAQ